MKINPEVVVYGAVGIVALVLGYKLWEALAHPLAQVGKMADQAATNYGAEKSAAQYGPQTAYDAARTAYAASIGYSLQGMGVATLPGWPTFTDWQGGSGPAGFTYGSPNYPAPPHASVWTAMASVF